MVTRKGAGVLAVLAIVGAGCILGSSVAGAQTVMQQCGQQYQAAKAANQLNGQSWNQFRSACAARLKTQPAAATPAVAPAAPAVANPLRPATVPAAPPPMAPAPTTAAAPTLDKNGKPMSPGRAAFVTRERQCGAEWRANKAALAAQTPGLTWPKYFSQCNARLKASGQ